ncbi:creatininase family protein [Hoeflea poritis]|uniref:Creatininase family protein n=1 Tax=Hoeflea poritis TaxID=2993659 RepID=A0ABT4VR97_9HYPH|nr:creatininase family protein [Hoeflea poritis]MDA4847196.1 creatininase family protein [Hoeflea poritis]
MVFPARNWDENDQDLDPQERHDWIAVLPLGAHEQHGPHLPFETDTIIADGIADAVAGALPPHLPVTFLPTEPVGYSIEHMDSPGTRSLGWQEAVERWIGTAEMLHRSGVRKLVMLNAHGGNAPLMTIVATEARVRFNMLAVATSWTRFGVPEGIVTAREKAIGIHAGEIETSVMLALHPDLVDIARAADFDSFQETMEHSATHLRAYGPHAFGWKMADLNPAGATGNALAATADKGRALIAHSARGLVELLEDVHRFDTGRLR